MIGAVLAAAVVLALILSTWAFVRALRFYLEARRLPGEREPSPWDNLPGARAGAADDPGVTTRIYSRKRFVESLEFPKRIDSHLN